MTTGRAREDTKNIEIVCKVKSLEIAFIHIELYLLVFVNSQARQSKPNTHTYFFVSHRFLFVQKVLPQLQSSKFLTQKLNRIIEVSSHFVYKSILLNKEFDLLLLRFVNDSFEYKIVAFCYNTLQLSLSIYFLFQSFSLCRG